MERKIEVGSVVRLPSESQVFMTVIKISGNLATVIWLDDSKESNFMEVPVECLV